MLAVMADDDDTPGDLASLRRQHPGWDIQLTWVSSAAGSGVPTWHATDGTVMIIAYTPASLAAQIRQAQAAR
jgi:hypothetical protein